jgi:peptidylprolyl isomerase
MRFSLPIIVLLFAAGCYNPDVDVAKRAYETSRLMNKRVKGIDTRLPPPEMDKPGPQNPDPKKIAEQSAKITAFKIEDITVGSGALASKGMVVYVRYRGELPDGFVFDTNRRPNQDLLSFTIGDGSVVKGFDRGIEGMRVGGRRKIYVPADMGYGPDPRPGSRIPKNCPLIFYVDLMFVSKPEE